MRFIDRYPIIITTEKNPCRDFWVRHLGFTTGFDSSWFVWLQAPGASATIAFMSPDHPSAPPGPECFSGQGLCFEMQVDDIESAFATVVESGARIEYPLTTEPFGQRRFGLRDPSGLWIDVLEQVEPEGKYWDQFMLPALHAPAGKANHEEP